MSEMLLSEAIEALCTATRARGRSPRTVQSYREKLSYLLTFLGDVHVEEISTADLRGYVAHLYDRDLALHGVDAGQGDAPAVQLAGV